MDIFVSSCFAGRAGFAGATAPFAATPAGLDDVLLACFEGVAETGLAAGVEFFVVLATGVMDAAGLLAAGLATGAELPADFAGAGAAVLAGCDWPALGLAVFGEGEEENFSLIFWKKDVCAEALPTSVTAISN